MTSRISSTHLFHGFGFNSNGAVDWSFSSKCSMFILAIKGETGLPIAVPNFCLQSWPLNVKYVVEGMNSSSSRMSFTSNKHLSFHSGSFSSRSVMTFRDSPVGMFVKMETTSWETSISSLFKLRLAKSAAMCWEFFTKWSVFTARAMLSAVGSRNSVCPSVCLSVRPFVHPSVRHTRALWLIQRTYRRYFYTTGKGNPLVKCDFSYSYAAADKISTDLRACTVSLRQLSYLFQ